MSATSHDLNRLRIDRAAETPAGRSALPSWLGWILVLLVLGGGGYAAWTQLPRAIPVTEAEIRVVGGPSATPAGGLSASGYVVARLSAEVAPAMAGRVAELYVDEGAVVAKGALLARLESNDLKAQLDAASATLAQVLAQLPPAERNLSRARDLLGSGAGTGVDLERAQDQIDVLSAQRAAAEAQVRVVQTSIGNTEVRAPFAGTVLRKRAEVGEFVAPGAGAGPGLGGAAGGIVELSDLQSLEVEVDVNELYIARVTPQQPAVITLDSLPDLRFPGQVRTIVPTADRQKATVRVRVSFEVPDPRVLPEMGAKVAFVDEAAALAAKAPPTPKELRAPRSALVGGEGASAVFVIEEGRARRQGVTVSGTDGDEAIIAAGLVGSERLVARPPPGLTDGAAVTLQP